MSAALYQIRTSSEIDAIARAGDLLWRILQEARPLVRPGIRTIAIDALIASRIQEHSAQPVMLLAGFPAASSICVNDIAVHGVPDRTLLRVGDVVTIDAALRLDGWCADASIAAVVGELGAPDSRLKLAAAARAATDAVIAALRPGVPWSHAAAAAHEVARSAGCAIITHYAGHAIGRELHEAPAFAFDPGAGPGPTLLPGMVFTVEPILTTGSAMVYGGGDSWPIRTQDGGLACHEERTVAMIEGGSRRLTGG